MNIHPYLNFAGNAEEAFEFYRSVFGGEFSSLVRFKDMPIPGVTVPEEHLDKIMHVGLPVGADTMLMASDALGALGPGVVQGNSVHISIQPDSREDADRYFNALGEGGSVEMPIAEQMWGDYYGSLKDKFGVLWMVNYSPPREGEAG